MKVIYLHGTIYILKSLNLEMLKNFELRVETPNRKCNLKCVDHLQLLTTTEITILPLFSIQPKQIIYKAIVNGSEVFVNYIYLASNKNNGEIYWVRYYFSGGLGYFKIMSKFIRENGVFSFVPVKGKNIDNVSKYNYDVYEISYPLFDIPSSGVKIIRGDKKKWDDLCELVKSKNIASPVSRIINVLDLIRFISEFF